MRQGPNNKRMRGRGGGRKHSNPRNHTYESNGPDVKVRGNPQQIVEKYLTLARDAYSAGDRVSAENYYQHAEHYYRVLNAGQPTEQRLSTPSADLNTLDDDDETETTEAEEVGAAEEAAPAAANGSDRPSGGRRRGNGRRKDPSEAPQPDIDAVAADEPSSEGAGENATA